MEKMATCTYIPELFSMIRTVLSRKTLWQSQTFLLRPRFLSFLISLASEEHH